MKHEVTEIHRKPIVLQNNVVSLANAVKPPRQYHEEVRPWSNMEETQGLKDLISNASTMVHVRDLIRQAAPSDVTVLIRGESGTGKELVAKALHYASSRNGKPFVDVNCAALTETLVESELFGHERGAFTGANSRRRGKFEQAHGGTLFLDEIGDMSPTTQAKMLRVLQERSFQRIGGEEKINVDVRVVCATNHNLEEAIKQGAFRMDLFYRINMIVIEVPPLRHRLSDVPELARHFVARANRSGQCRAREISDAAFEALCGYNWPGNVRELQNAIERAVTICNEEQIQPSHLPPAVLRHSALLAPQRSNDLGSWNFLEAVEQFQRNFILAALERCAWNQTHTSNTIGVTRRILSYKMRSLGIKKTELKN
jgi:DNA-binding NtrC family response regulator